MTLTASQMSSLQPVIHSPHVKQESGALGVNPKPKDGAKKCILDKVKKLLDQLEDVLVMAVNDMGEIQLLASPNLKHDKWKIMQDAHETFYQYMQDRNPTSDIPELARLGTGQLHKSRSQAKKPFHGLMPEGQAAGGSISQVAQRPAKRQRSRTLNAPSRVTIPVRQPRERRSRRPSLNDALAFQIEVRDRERLEQWFREAFLTMQQVACRLVAKVWIKKIHPKKQSTHPYNGVMPRDQEPDSNRTRPPYWPTSVIHREPDHIGRDDRVNLLVHLIMNTPQPIIQNPADPDNQLVVTARDLADCLEEKRGELKEGPWEIVQQVIRTREAMEQFKSGEIDGENLVFLNDYSDRSTLAQVDSENELGSANGNVHVAASDDSTAGSLGDEHTLTPASSTLHSPAENLLVPVVEQLLGSRSRRSAVKDKTRNRPTAGQQSRPSLSTDQLSPIMIPPAPQEIPIDMALGMGRFECNMDATMQDAMIGEPGLDMSQLHAHNLMNYGIGQQLPTGISMVPDAFGQDINASAHDLVLLDHQSSHDMMHGFSHSMQGQDGLNYQPWLAMLSDMSPDPAPFMCGLHQHMQIQAQGPPHGYLDPLPTELVGGMHNSLSLMDPSASYQDLNHGLHLSLPVRVMSEPNVRMLSPTEQDLESPNVVGPYYMNLQQ